MTEPNGRRGAKKSDVIEVRVSPDEKAAFMAACAKAGDSASSVLRDAMRRYPRLKHSGRVLMISSFAAALALAVSMPAILSVVKAGPEAGIAVAESDLIETAFEFTLTAVEDDARSTSRVASTVRVIPGETMRLELDRLPAAHMGSLFGDLDAAQVRSVDFYLTPVRDEETGGVFYQFEIVVRNGDGEPLGEALRPALLARPGEASRLALNGQDGSSFELTVTPAS